MVFGCVWMCLDMLGEKLERGERICPKTTQFFFFLGKMRGLGVFMDLGTPFEAHGAQDRASGLIRCDESTS